MSIPWSQPAKHLMGYEHCRRGSFCMLIQGGLLALVSGMECFNVITAQPRPEYTATHNRYTHGHTSPMFRQTWNSPCHLAFGLWRVKKQTCWLLVHSKNPETRVVKLDGWRVVQLVIRRDATDRKCVKALREDLRFHRGCNASTPYLTCFCFPPPLKCSCLT